jgi:hypothetical protein
MTSEDTTPHQRLKTVITSQRVGAKRRPMTGSAKQSIVRRKERMDCFVASAFARRRASADKSAPLRKRFAFVAGNDDKTQFRDLAA